MIEGSTVVPPSVLGSQVVLYIAAYITIFIVGLSFYVMKSVGLATLARNQGIGYAWAAWLPFCDFHILGRLIGPFRFFGYRIVRPDTWLPLGLLLVILAGYVPIINVVSGVVYFLFVCTALYRLYSLYSPANAIWFILLSIFMLFPVLIYLMRNNYPQDLYE